MRDFDIIRIRICTLEFSKVIELVGGKVQQHNNAFYSYCALSTLLFNACDQHKIVFKSYIFFLLC